MTNFLTLDVETANADYSSICQIGIVQFKNGEEVDSWTTLINPNSYFDPFNVSIHGIEAKDVINQPTFVDVFDQLNLKMKSNIVVHHGHFDRTSFARTYDNFELNPISCRWLDSTKIVRRTWEKYARKGYGLSNLANEFNIDFDHHNALDDARTAGYIVLAAIKESGKGINEWADFVQQPLSSNESHKNLKRDGNVDAPFFGEKIAFTGSLNVPKTTAADVAQKLGFDVQPSVTLKTTYLCVGIQDQMKLAGYSKSSKHRKAEELIEKGHELAILTEDDFWAIAKIYDTGEL